MGKDYLDQDTTDIHPRVKQAYKGFKYLGPGMLLLFLVFAIGPYYFFRREFGGWESWYFLYVVLPGGVAFLAAYLYIGSTFGRGFRQMSRVMSTTEPREMLLKGLGVGLGGRERAELYLDGAILGLVRIKTPNDGLFFKKGKTQPAMVYLDPTGKQTFLVIDTGKQLVWGDLGEVRP